MKLSLQHTSIQKGVGNSLSLDKLGRWKFSRKRLKPNRSISLIAPILAETALYYFPTQIILRDIGKDGAHEGIFTVQINVIPILLIVADQ